VRSQAVTKLPSSHAYISSFYETSIISPSKLMIFFYENIATAVWDLISYTISEQIILVYKRGYRIATVEILRDYPMFGRQTTGIISVVPDDAVASNPFNQYKLRQNNPD
jgi:hypothetical protein